LVARFNHTQSRKKERKRDNRHKGEARSTHEHNIHITPLPGYRTTDSTVSSVQYRSLIHSLGHTNAHTSNVPRFPLTPQQSTVPLHSTSHNITSHHDTRRDMRETKRRLYNSLASAAQYTMPQCREMKENDIRRSILARTEKKMKKTLKSLLTLISLVTKWFVALVYQRFAFHKCVAVLKSKNVWEAKKENNYRPHQQSRIRTETSHTHVQ